MTYRVGVDSGGTFTDLLVLDDQGGRLVHKTTSTSDDPALAVVKGLGEVAERLGKDLPTFISEVEAIVHGTTVSTNALLTRNGAFAGLICTEGFRDTLPLRDGRREEPYNNRLPMPVPLVPRHLRLGVPGRLEYTGRELTPLDEDAVRAAAHTLGEAGVEAVTICLVHSPANMTHEQRAAEIVREVLPDVQLTVSSELLAQVGLFERTSTAVLNSYVSPIIARYVDSLTESLVQVGFSGVLLLMQSNGGVAAPEILSSRAALSLLSGPASGPAAGLSVVEPLGREDCITVDMGGTSFDTAIVRGGVPLVMTDGWVDRWRLALPMLDIHTVGAGGGSVAFANAGMLRVGPFSAGADPGPACYGKGGKFATVTDADLVLGYLGTGGLLGGNMGLDAAAAAAAITSEVAEPLGMTLLEAAAGIYEIVNVNMAEGVREVSINRGWDPRDFPLVVAGGAGPVHAAAIAEEIGIPILVVPRESAVFCAGGMLLADFKHDYVRSYKGLLDEVDVQVGVERWAEMRVEGERTLESEGIAPVDRVVLPSMDLRYKGQWHELTMEVPVEEIDAPDLVALAKRFHERHDQLFGYSTPDMAIEVMNVRVAVQGRTGESSTLSSSATGAGRVVEAATRRDAWSRVARAMIPFGVYDGLALEPGDRFSGPALVELPTTTIIVPEAFSVFVDTQGSYVLFTDQVADEVIASLTAGAR